MCMVVLWLREAWHYEGLCRTLYTWLGLHLNMAPMMDSATWTGTERLLIIMVSSLSFSQNNTLNVTAIPIGPISAPPTVPVLQQGLYKVILSHTFWQVLQKVIQSHTFWIFFLKSPTFHIFPDVSSVYQQEKSGKLREINFSSGNQGKLWEIYKIQWNSGKFYYFDFFKLCIIYYSICQKFFWWMIFFFTSIKI